jgi:hypothetical protein
VRTLTLAASAAANFNIRIPSLELVAWQLQPPRRPGWNNALRNYT